MRYFLIVLALLAVSLAAFAADKPTYTPPTADEIAAVQKQGRYLVTITMANDQKIEIVLEGKEAPLTVANYVKLVQAKFYDGLTFHRIENRERAYRLDSKGELMLQPPFKLIQGGDPNGNGSGGPGYKIKLEIAPTLRHKRGAVAMAREQAPNTAGCQFYITKCDTSMLDGNYAVFGWVKSGMEVVDAVKVGDAMKTVTVEPYNGAEPCPIAETKTPAAAPAN